MVSGTPRNSVPGTRVPGTRELGTPQELPLPTEPATPLLLYVVMSQRYFTPLLSAPEG